MRRYLLVLVGVLWVLMGSRPAAAQYVTIHPDQWETMLAGYGALDGPGGSFQSWGSRHHNSLLQIRQILDASVYGGSGSIHHTLAGFTLPLNTTATNTGNTATYASSASASANLIYARLADPFATGSFHRSWNFQDAWLRDLLDNETQGWYPLWKSQDTFLREKQTSIAASLNQVESHTAHLPFMRQSLDGINVNVSGMTQYVKDGVTDALFPIASMMEDLHWYEGENYYAWQNWRTQWGLWRNNWNTERDNFVQWRAQALSLWDQTLNGETPYLGSILTLLTNWHAAWEQTDNSALASYLSQIRNNTNPIGDIETALGSWRDAWDGERDSFLMWRQMTTSGLEYYLQGSGEQPYLKSILDLQTAWYAAWLEAQGSEPDGGTNPGDFTPAQVQRELSSNAVEDRFTNALAEHGIEPFTVPQAPNPGGAPVWNVNVPTSGLGGLWPYGDLAFTVNFSQFWGIRDMLYPWWTIFCTLGAMWMVWEELRRYG